MVVPLHAGFQHPSVLWSVAIGLFAFVIGLCVNLYRSNRRLSSARSASDENAK